MIRAILFDYGLTLVSFSYPRPQLLAAMERVRGWLPPPAPSANWILEQVLVPLEEGLAEFDRATGGSDYFAYYRAAWRRAGLDLDSDTLWRIIDLEQDVWASAVIPAPGVHSALRTLRARGLGLAVASNAPFPGPMLHRQLRRQGLLELVDGAVFSSELGCRKPDPRFYRAALERFGWAPQDVIYVGDRLEEDYLGPLRAGMAAVICRALAAGPIAAQIPSIAALEQLPEYLGGLG
ncbi:MAG TPA: HAD family hydrolase [Candidatus Nitrosotalea sp.]|nr:HAD family hydrolase [Candidatus Nitrosotalea sp.]